MPLTPDEIRAIFGVSPPVVPNPVVVPAPVPAAKGGWFGHVMTAVLTLAVALGGPALLSRWKPGPVAPTPPVVTRPPVTPPTKPPPVVTPPPVITPPSPTPSDPLSVAAREYITGIPKGFRATAAEVRSSQVKTVDGVVTAIGERRKAAGQPLADQMNTRLKAMADPDGNLQDAPGVATALETAAAGMEGAAP